MSNNKEKAEAERFTAPRPAFVTPKDEGLLTPKSQDHHAPAPSLVTRAVSEGNDKIAALLEKAQKDAKEQAKIIEAAKKPSTQKKRTKKEEEKSEGSTSGPQFEPHHVMSDIEFVKLTRAGDNFTIHDPEVKAIFWANGGERHLVGDLSYAQAFENLRREKLNSLLPGSKSETKYNRVLPLPPGTKVWTPGVPTMSDLAAKARAEAEAKARKENAHYIGFVKPPKR